MANPSEFKYRSPPSNGLNTRNSAAFRVRSGRGETVDAADLKSAPRKGVWVRLPSSAPTQRSQGTEDAREPRSPGANLSRKCEPPHRSRSPDSPKTKPGGGPGGPFLTLAAARCGALPIESGCRGTGSAPQWFFSRATQKRTEGTPPMKGILIRAATVLLGVSAYVGLGIALASAG